MHQQILPDQRADRRHHEERRYHQEPHQGETDDRLVHQQRNEDLSTTVMARTAPTMISVLPSALMNPGSVRK